MNAAKIINLLNEEFGWSYYRLAKEAAISPSTLTNMMKRGTSPSIDTLEKICGAYGMTISDFLNYDTEQRKLTSQQSELLHLWFQLTRGQKRAVLSMLREMVPE